MGTRKHRIAPLAIGTLPVLIAADFFAAAVFGWVLPASAHLLAGAAFVAIAYFGTLPYGTKAAAGLAGTFALLALVLFVFPFGQRKSFIRKANRISGGMGRAEVVQIMGEPDSEILKWPLGDDADQFHVCGHVSCTVRYGADDRVQDAHVSAEPTKYLARRGAVADVLP
jgi:hypothetical protein